MSLRTLVGIISGITLAVGLLMLLLPISTCPELNPTSCGSAVSPHDFTYEDAGASIASAITGERASKSHAAECADLIGDRRGLAWSLTIAGAVVLAGVVLVQRQASSGSVHDQPVRGTDDRNLG